MTEITSVGSAREFLRHVIEDEFGHVVVLTGAGISTESGVPDFRSPGGLWSKLQPIEFQDFLLNPESRREDWRRRFEMKRIFDAAQPNAAHEALARLAAAGGLDLLITQNIDGLHQRAGTPADKLIELHGNSTYASCLECLRVEELEPLEKTWQAGQVPLCSACGGLLKAAVVSFGQAMPEDATRKAFHSAGQAGVFIVVGSSLLVHPAAQLPLAAVRAGARLVVVNRQETPLDDHAEACIRSPIAETFEGFG
ncbi:SIR2 family NAD-dependent protein deacylase [Roseibium sp.]|uniref:SIR2 family NAD-dependent protein deacylase n=1 Tax=Roseibium sp. TaxID=1936156 RepID=UPI003A969024